MDNRRNNWKRLLILYIALGAILYAGISYFAISRLLSKPAPTKQQMIKQAHDRALTHPYMKVSEPPGNAILELSKEYQITYEANQDQFTFNIYSTDPDKTRLVAEDYFVNKVLQVSDKNIACGLNVLIAVSGEKAAHIDWGPYTKLSFCK